MKLILKNGFYEFPNINTEDDIYLSEHESLIELFSDYNDGFYEMEILETDNFEGQEGEYGSWEIAPYNIITKIEMDFLGNISDSYITLSEKQFLEQESLKTKAKELQDYVRKLFKGEYILHSPWGHSLSFSKVKTDTTFFVTEPIHKFSCEMSEKNFKHIKEVIDNYYNYELLISDDEMLEKEAHRA